MKWLGKVDVDTITLAILAGAETMHAGSAFMPSGFTVKTLAIDGNAQEIERKLCNLRSGYRPAVVFGLGLSTLVSILAKSTLPLIVSAAAAVYMLTQYESFVPPDLRLNTEQIIQVLLSGKGEPSNPNLLGGMTIG